MLAGEPRFELGAAFNGFVAKPLDPNVLADEIVGALGTR